MYKHSLLISINPDVLYIDCILCISFMIMISEK